MTERANTGHSILFHDVMKGYADDESDPAIADLFAQITDLELALNTSNTVTEAQLDAVREELNKEIESLDLVDEIVYVSGIVRPEACGIFTNGIPTDVQDQMPRELEGFGELMRDEFGPYYTVYRKKFYCGSAFLPAEEELDEYSDDESVDEYETDSDTEPSSTSSTLGIAIALNITDDGDPRHGDFYIFPSELSEFYPEDATDRKAVRVVSDKYPAIASELDTLPEASGSDKKIIEALRKLNIVVDWADYPGITQDEAERLFDYIGRYMMKRLDFDTEPYMLRLQSEVLVRGSDKALYQKEIEGTRNVMCRIHGIELRPADNQEDTPASGARFVPVLRCLISSSERKGGHYDTLIPLTSIRWARTTRNAALFDEDFLETTTIEEVDDVDVVDDVDEILYSDPASPLADDSPTFTVDVLNDESDHERMLASLNIRYTELFSQVEQYTGVTYTSESDASEAAGKIAEIIKEFLALYPFDSRVVIDIEGPGAHTRPAVHNADKSSFDQETNELHLVFDNVGIQESSIIRPYQGVLLDKYDIKLHVRNDGYTLEAQMYMTDAGYSEPYSVNHPYYEVPLFQLLPVRRIAFRIDSAQTSISLPGYAQMRDFRDTLRIIQDQVADLAELPAQLQALYEVMDVPYTTSFNTLENVALINEIGSQTGGDERATDLAVDALTNIFKNKPIRVTGGAYDASGKYMADQQVNGIVRDVIATTQAIPVNEPLLVIRDQKQGNYYVPLSAITRLEY